MRYIHLSQQGLKRLYTHWTAALVWQENGDIVVSRLPLCGDVCQIGSSRAGQRWQLLIAQCERAASQRPETRHASLAPSHAFCTSHRTHSWREEDILVTPYLKGMSVVEPDRLIKPIKAYHGLIDIGQYVTDVLTFLLTHKHTDQRTAAPPSPPLIWTAAQERTKKRNCIFFPPW